jgi:acyl-CoA reductase-like NAD-dependent aldehyde dehydrogenase
MKLRGRLPVAPLRRSLDSTTGSEGFLSGLIMRASTLSAHPFGGVKQSGTGCEESTEELLEFTQIKNVHMNLEV